MAKVRPIADGFVIPASHRRIAFSRLAGTLNSAAAYSIAAASYRETQAFLGYMQSDEIGLVWLCDTPENEPLFGGKVHKLTSLLASLTAAHFQFALAIYFERDEACGYRAWHRTLTPASYSRMNR